MNDSTDASPAPRSLWVRALLMLLMYVALSIAVWVLCIVAVVQLIFAAINDGEANPRLRAFGSAVGQYMGQIAAFGSFATEDLPFPFSDWPTGE